MLDRSDVIYTYDGSFDGFLCCVFESYDKKEIPLDIMPDSLDNTTLFPAFKIMTDAQKAGRVKKSLVPYLGADGALVIRHAFLSNLEKKEINMLLFLRLAYKIGKSVLNMLSHPVVKKINDAVKFFWNEYHSYQGFLRFSVHDGVMIAVISPKNCLLSFLGMHFKERFPLEKFMIYDKNHKQAFIYSENKYTLIDMEDFILPHHDAKEIYFQNLWRIFHKTIAIEGRENKKLQKQLMPKRYWEHLTEMTQNESEIGLLAEK